jgi:hypothetical protein
MGAKRYEGQSAMAGKKEKKKKKDSQLVIRVSAEERDAFVTLCEALDSSASRELRRFMKRFVGDHEAAQKEEEKN